MLKARARNKGQNDVASEIVGDLGVRRVKTSDCDYAVEEPRVADELK